MVLSPGVYLYSPAILLVLGGVSAPFLIHFGWKLMKPFMFCDRSINITSSIVRFVSACPNGYWTGLNVFFFLFLNLVIGDGETRVVVRGTKT